jgi:hypothetical protein
MPFTANNATIGVPEFGLIKINPEETAKAFQAYLAVASNLTGVSLDDINRKIIKAPANEGTVTLTELVESGMKLFDAVVWLTAGRPKTHPLQIDPTMTKSDLPSMHDIARAVFYVYFMLVTQARYPASAKSEAKPKIPNFLSVIMGMDKPQHEYVATICSFEPTKFDPAWVRHVQFESFGQEVLSRFGLGVAGYRMFGPFALYSARDDMDPKLLPAFEFARKVATARSSWSIHPLTRRPDVLSKRGNLNKNLGNLMLEAFSESDLKEMEKIKVIYKVPEKEPTHRNYRMWTAEDDITGTDFIFRD